jgi:hypothetical protein
VTISIIHTEYINIRIIRIRIYPGSTLPWQAVDFHKASKSSWQLAATSLAQLQYLTVNLLALYYSELHLYLSTKDPHYYRVLLLEA